MVKHKASKTSPLRPLTAHESFCKEQAASFDPEHAKNVREWWKYNKAENTALYQRHEREYRERRKLYTEKCRRYRKKHKLVKPTMEHYLPKEIRDRKPLNAYFRFHSECSGKNEDGSKKYDDSKFKKLNDYCNHVRKNQPELMVAYEAEYSAAFEGYKQARDQWFADHPEKMEEYKQDLVAYSQRNREIMEEQVAREATSEAAPTGAHMALVRELTIRTYQMVSGPEAPMKRKTITYELPGGGSETLEISTPMSADEVGASAEEGLGSGPKRAKVAADSVGGADDEEDDDDVDVDDDEDDEEEAPVARRLDAGDEGPVYDGSVKSLFKNSDILSGAASKYGELALPSMRNFSKEGFHLKV